MAVSVSAVTAIMSCSSITIINAPGTAGHSQLSAKLSSGAYDHIFWCVVNIDKLHDELRRFNLPACL